MFEQKRHRDAIPRHILLIPRYHLLEEVIWIGRWRCGIGRLANAELGIVVAADRKVVLAVFVRPQIKMHLQGLGDAQRLIGLDSGVIGLKRR